MYAGTFATSEGAESHVQQYNKESSGTLAYTVLDILVPVNGLHSGILRQNASAMLRSLRRCDTPFTAFAACAQLGPMPSQSSSHLVSGFCC